MKKITTLFLSLFFVVLAEKSMAQNCSANFIWSNWANGVVGFTSTSVGTTSLTTYYWNFGNGATYSATGVNGMGAGHQYTANGTYTVTLFIWSTAPTCSSGIQYTVSVNNSTACALNANFSLSQGANGAVHFNNTSTGTVTGSTYVWTFGDNSAPDSTASTSHTYASNGSYVVTLSISNNSNPQCTSTKTMMVNVNSYCNLNASFTSTQGTNGNVTFVSTSTGTNGGTLYSWKFGDGNSLNNSNSPNTSHVYVTGSYIATLTISSGSVNPTCTSTYTQSFSVTNTCVANANFSLNPTNTPQHWNAIPSATNNVVGAQWNWGDGSISNTLYTSHQYSVAGNYSICLSVTVSCGAAAHACSTYSIYRSAEGMITVNVINPATVGIKELNKFNELNIYPNPASESVQLSVTGLDADYANVQMLSLLGTLLSETKVQTTGNNLSHQIILKDLSEGVYFLRVSAGDSVETRKIIVKH